MEKGMKIKSLFSSSDGNSCLVATDEESILIDAGASWKQIQNVTNNNQLINKLVAVFISHEHGDHVSGAGIVGRKTGATIYIPQASYEKRAQLFNKTKLVFINGGDEIPLESLSIKAFSTRHDSVESLGFTVTEVHTGAKFAYLTDTGSISKLIRENLHDCDALLIEADYDPQMLEDYDEYDPLLKDRIRSPFGHLGTDQAIAFVSTLDLDKIQWIMFGHISQQTNSIDKIKSHIKNKIEEKYWQKFKIAPNSNFLEITKK